MYFKDMIDEAKENFDLKKILFPLIIGIVFIIGIILIIIGNRTENSIVTNDKNNYTISLLGNKEMTIYEGNEYLEPGYTAMDNKGKNLTREVFVDNQVNSYRIGTYKVKYILKKISIERIVNVVEKPVGATYIHLIGDLTMYLNAGSEYKEPGYEVIDTVDGNLKSKVKITDNININKAGIYKRLYTVINSSGVTTSKQRTIIVMDSEISLTLDNENYTNSNANIHIYVNDPYFSHTILPNGNRINEKNYLYSINGNGKYKFIVYNIKGDYKEATITVNNINKTAPSGSCSGEYKNGLSTIRINASDDIGISRYVINNNTYTTNEITINGEIETANVTIYDKAGNSSKISCNLEDKTPVIIEGNCTGSYQNGVSTIKINATSNRGIAKYMINGNSYTSNEITLKGEFSMAKVTIYDTKSNTKEISCNLVNKNTYNIIKNISSREPIKKTENIYLGYYKTGFSFWIYVPDNLTSDLPIVMFLGGLGEKGNDYYGNSSTAINVGPIHEVMKYGYKYNAIIVHPQVPGEYDVYGFLSSYIELLNSIAKNFNANKKKISIMGFSHGCYGVMNIMKDNRKYFSATVPIGCDPKNRASYFKYTPTWAFAGAGDGVNSLPEFVNQINNMGGYAKFTRPPHHSHNVLSDNYSILRDKNYNVIDWMISQKRS